MAADQGPVVQSARLRSELVRFRKESRLTQEQVAAELEWSPSKLIRVESGRRSIAKADLGAIPVRCTVISEDTRERIQALNSEARQRGWRDKYADDVFMAAADSGHSAGMVIVRHSKNPDGPQQDVSYRPTGEESDNAGRDGELPDADTSKSARFDDLDGRLCGLVAVDIVGFNGSRRDQLIQMYVHKSLYEILPTAFDRSNVPWSGCKHEDRGDGTLVIIPPIIPVAGLVSVPDKLRRLVRQHNYVSKEAAHVQLRVAMHIGFVNHDGHGFVGRDVNLLFRLLEMRRFKRMLSESGGEVAVIVSDSMYEKVVCNQPLLVDPTLFQRLSGQVKETKATAWACTLGPLPLGLAEVVRLPALTFA